MKFSSLAGCLLACRFSKVRALPSGSNSAEKTKKFVYAALLNSSYKQIIESHLPISTRIIYGDANGKFAFEYRGIKESVHAVAVIDDVPHLVRVILVTEDVIKETLPIKYNSAAISSQALMALSGQTGRPTIEKTLIITVNTSDYSVNSFVIDADDTEQLNIKNKIDFVLAADNQRIEKVKCEQCSSCGYSDLCENKSLPLVACTTCAFYNDDGMATCSLGNSVGIKCPQHIYNPLLLVNHKHVKVDVQNLYVEYDEFINCNQDMGFKPSLTSEEMFSSHKLDNGKILEKNLYDFKNNFGAKIINATTITEG